jgi:hypothetical protein
LVLTDYEGLCYTFLKPAWSLASAWWTEIIREMTVSDYAALRLVNAMVIGYMAGTREVIGRGGAQAIANQLKRKL